eukprot:SAG31_NODE_102_length_25175_cov_10.778553_9_plen_84_part_00
MCSPLSVRTVAERWISPSQVVRDQLGVHQGPAYHASSHRCLRAFDWPNYHVHALRFQIENFALEEEIRQMEDRLEAARALRAR